MRDGRPYNVWARLALALAGLVAVLMGCGTPASGASVRTRQPAAASETGDQENLTHAVNPEETHAPPASRDSAECRDCERDCDGRGTCCRYIDFDCGGDATCSGPSDCAADCCE